jgi:hypothetical protein
LRGGGLAADRRLERREFHVIMFLAVLPTGVAGGLAIEGGVETVGPRTIRDRMGPDLEMEALVATGFHGTGSWTLAFHALPDLDPLPLYDLLSGGRIQLGRTPRAAPRRLRSHGAGGGADLDRATSRDQDKGRDGHGEAKVHREAI